MIQVTGKNLGDLWLNFLVHIATGNYTQYYYPSIFVRKVYGETEGIHFDKDIIEKDYFKYSGYNRNYKLKRLEHTYFSKKVQKQYDLLTSTIRQLQPRQARGFLKFSEAAFNKTDRLMCLDSLFIQKVTMTSYDALLIFRNTEIWPKTYCDFILVYNLLEGFIKERVKCVSFGTLITSCFINFHQAPTGAMFLRRYGITSWNEPFRKSLKKWKDMFNTPKQVKAIKMQWILRVVERTHRLMDIDGINIDILIEGK